ncbi:hypothetical protein [Curtobacterium sp. MMLR14_010]|uniref:hypothetical protein n=1 Tax=Curtobacterium sp. MMLR14_010 TaxID=1898743 RepID=UPI00158779C0|nr:hypothetical protein [Curtobacterium sp. MMLR14_010]
MYGNGLALMLGAGTLTTLLIAEPASIAIGLGLLVVTGAGLAALRIAAVRRARRHGSCR